MNEHTPKHNDAWRTLMDAAAGEGDVARAEAILAAHPEWRDEFEQYRALSRDLEALGRNIADGVPEVDLADGIFAAIDAVKRGERTVPDDAYPGDPDVQAYAEGKTDDLSRTRVEKRIAATPNLQDDVNALRDTTEKLQAAADAYNADIPAIDIRKAVMDAVMASNTVLPVFSEAEQNLLDAYIDGALEADGLERLRTLAEANPALMDEWRALQAFENELGDLGESLVAHAPEIDLTASIMNRVEAERAKSNVVPMRARPKPNLEERPAESEAPWLRYGTVAAAACLLIAVGFFARPWIDANSGGTNLAKTTIGPEGPATGTAVPEGERDGEGRYVVVTPEGEFVVAQPTPKPLEFGVDGEPEAPEFEPPRHEGLSLRDAIALRRKSLMNDDEAGLKLGQLASLTPEEARGLIDSSTLTTAAEVGAARFLPADEAVGVLRDALAENPNDPFLNAALAQALMRDPSNIDEARVQLAAWSAVDPDNAMPRYMEAQLLMEAGDVDGALAALAEGGELPGAHAYSLDSAHNHQLTLAESGLDPDVAGFLAAVSAGSDEYATMTGAANELIAAGDAYAEAGDVETAEEIYESVERMSDQIKETATVTNDMVASRDIDLNLMDSLDAVSDILTPAGTMLLGMVNADLLETAINLTQIYAGATGALNSGDLTDTIAWVGRTLMGEELTGVDSLKQK